MPAKQPRLTIGMAHFSDFDGVYFTVQSLRLHHSEAMKQAELIIVDNSPQLPTADPLKGLVDNCCAGGTPARYIEMAEGGGTTQTRERVFAEAAGDFVLVCDCHVLFEPGAIGRLLRFYEKNPLCDDLISGPMMMDTYTGLCTHFDDVWRRQMWGIWGQAWTCSCGRTHFSVSEYPAESDDHEYDPSGGVFYRSLVEQGPLTMKCRCDPPPDIAYAGHERTLREVGFRTLGQLSDPPFAIPAQGLGVFSARKASWLGFNPLFRGFGGEEWYIHTKYRNAGRSCMSLPALRWVHRFARPAGVPYVPTLWNKARNYAIGLREVGLSLERMKDHFLAETNLSENQWEYLMADPESHTTPPVAEAHHTPTCQDCQRDLAPMETVAEVHEYYAKAGNDFNTHFPTIRRFADVCSHVTEFGSRDYGVAALVGHKPKYIRSYNTQPQGAAYWKLELLAKEIPDLNVIVTHENHIEQSALIEETDLLFIDSRHTREQLAEELRLHAWRVRRFIILHDTELFGFNGEGGGPGLKPALIEFMQKNKEWSVIYASKDQAGLMVLGKLPEDKPRKPHKIAMATNFIKHLAEHVADGSRKVSSAHLESRLMICTLCELRTRDEACSMCGCPVMKKAAWRSSTCDANRWAEVDLEFAKETDDALEVSE